MPKPVEVSLPSDREVVVTRTFNAPRELVWDAHTKPELLSRWLFGPDGWSMPYCVVDLRVGGKYRYVWRNDADGTQFGSHGEHLEIAAPERIVTTEWMDGLDGPPINVEAPVGVGDPSINTLTLREKDGQTILTMAMVFPTKERRDVAVQSGMSDGMAMGYDRLDGVLDAEKVA